MPVMDNTPTVRINGALMGNYLNSKAVLFGFVQKLEPDGKRASVKTTDDQFVQVVFNNPVNFNLEQGSLIEAYGTVLNRNQFSCLQFTHFQPDVAEKFDSGAYNQFINYYINHLNRINITTPVDESTETVLKQLSNDFEIDWSASATATSGGTGAGGGETTHNTSTNDFDSW